MPPDRPTVWWFSRLMAPISDTTVDGGKPPEGGIHQPLPISRRRALIEALIVFGGATAVCSVLWQLRGVVPLIQRMLHDLIAAIFLGTPTLLLMRRRDDLIAFGLTSQPIGRGLVTFFAVSALIFPPFVFGFYAYYRTVCGWAAAGRAVPPVYRYMCPRFAGGWGAARLRLDWTFLKLVAAQLAVVALPEEYFFRGYLHTRMEQVWPPRRRIFGGGVGIALVMTSVLFALGHVLVDFNPLRFAVFFPSLLFGWMRGVTGSILAPVLFHASCNLVSDVLHRAFF